MKTSAPFFSDISEGPEGGYALWLMAADDVRIRVAHWPQEGAEGTVLLFPGRTEYAEKYGRVAADFAQRGLATMAIDWRGQGLSDRLADDPMLGHVGRFSDYQLDVDAMVAMAKAEGAAEPYYLLGHSMGGCIGLRAVYAEIPVKAASFSAPMWGIFLSDAMRPIAWALSNATSALGIGAQYAPGTKKETYVLSDPFDDNMLTTSEEMWDYMVRQARAKPELTLAGPSLRWLAQALKETRALDAMASPHLRAVTFLGTQERIVDVPRILSRMERWPQGKLVRVSGAEHEPLMEGDDKRVPVMDEMVEFFKETPI